jgi:hypothetical protein
MPFSGVIVERVYKVNQNETVILGACKSSVQYRDSLLFSVSTQQM